MKRQVFILLILALCLVLALTISAPKLKVFAAASAEVVQEGNFHSIEEFTQWMTYYYVQPEPDKILSAMKFYADSELCAQQTTRMPQAAFFACLLKNDSGLIKQVFDDISAVGSAKAKRMLLLTLWLINNTESKALIDQASLEWKLNSLPEIIQQLNSEPAQDILRDPIKDLAHLDMLWATFSATGDNTLVRKVISALPLKKNAKEQDVFIAQAAEWSLTNNAAGHQRVYALCQEELNNASGEIKRILIEIIRKLDSQSKE